MWQFYIHTKFYYSKAFQNLTVAYVFSEFPSKVGWFPFTGRCKNSALRLLKEEKHCSKREERRMPRIFEAKQKYFLITRPHLLLSSLSIAFHEVDGEMELRK